MAIEGPLRELALSDLFQMLDLSRKTGVLTVRSESRPHPAVVRFDRGAVVGAELPGTLGRLGHILVRAGKISEAQMEAALRQQQSDNARPFGTIMVEAGWISEEDVRRYLRFQVEETIFELIRWKEGYFRFEEIPGKNPGAVAIRLGIQVLLMEAARRIDEWTTLEALIPHMNVVPVLVSGELHGADGGTLDLRPNEWEVLGEIDGERTLKAIASELTLSDFAVAKIAFGLISAGVVEIASAGARPAAASAPNAASPARLAEVEDALRKRETSRAQKALVQLLRDHPDSADAYLLAGRVSGSLGRWREAYEALIRATQQDPLSSAAHYHLGFAAARVGELSRAEEAWTTFLRLDDSAPRRRKTATSAVKLVAALRKLLETEVE
jgi:TolA-binding protein